MEEVTEADNNLSISDSLHKKNHIQVSNTKKRLFFYVNLAKIYAAAQRSPALGTWDGFEITYGEAMAVDEGCERHDSLSLSQSLSLPICPFFLLGTGPAGRNGAPIGGSGDCAIELNTCSSVIKQFIEEGFGEELGKEKEKEEGGGCG